MMDRLHVPAPSVACLLGLALAVLAPAASAQTGPAPYRELEVSIPVPGGHVLSGTLTLPAMSRQVPAVVLISGSGAQDRDEAIPGEPRSFDAACLSHRPLTRNPPVPAARYLTRAR